MDKINLFSYEEKKLVHLNKYKIININHETKEYTIECDLCKNNYTIDIVEFYKRVNNNEKPCLKCNPYKQRENNYNDIKDFITNSINCELNKKIDEYNIDFFIPEYNLAIDYVDLYNGSEIFNIKKHYLNKLIKLEENNIQVLYIWQDDWETKPDIIKSIIKNKLNLNSNRIYARKCEIKELNDTKIIKKFIDDTHIQGYIPSAKKLGLFYNGEIVAAMTFGKGRTFMNTKSVEGCWEITRFTTKSDTSVIGAASKLLKHFIKIENPEMITSFADRSHSNGNLYRKLNFELVSETDPNYYYIVDGKRKHRFGFRKDVLVKNGFDENKGEHEIMLERTLFRIYNAGNLKYQLKV